MNPRTAKILLNKTKEDYKNLADVFSHSRKYLWEDFKEFNQYIKDGDAVLDLGCGNGRLFEMFNNKKINYTGVDNCKELIQEAKNKYGLSGANFLVSDALNTAFKSQKFDIIFCIAILNHIPSKDLRIKVLKNINLCLKKNGILIMTNWNLYQKKYFLFIVKYFFKKIISYFSSGVVTGLKALQACRALSPVSHPAYFKNLDFGDIFIPWKLKNKIIQRYYHAFTIRELSKLFEQTGFKVIKKYYTKKGQKANLWNGHNLVFICKKNRSDVETEFPKIFKK